MILSFRKTGLGKQCRPEQSDQGLHSLPFRLQLLDTLPYGKATLSEFLGFLCYQIQLKFKTDY